MCSPYGFLLLGYNTEKDGGAASGRQTGSIMQFWKEKKTPLHENASSRAIFLSINNSTEHIKSSPSHLGQNRQQHFLIL